MKNKRLAVIDNITDIDSVDNIQRLLNYLDIDHVSLYEWLTNDYNTEDGYIQNYIHFIVDDLLDDDTVDNLVEYFNIYIS